ncbi:WHEP-TRS domain [Popillia japonica]|uniref:WHEP-TRS domain n=1 Tax=Popillia japonica TaxID=7064 RepID=A0AAW1JDU5_POPJA
MKGYVSSLEKAKLRDGIRYMLSISRHGNQYSVNTTLGYIQSTQPWVLVKGTDEQKERAATIIGVCCNITYLLAALLYPYMPEASRTIKEQLNVTNLPPMVPSNPVITNLLQSGHKIGKPAPLFTKIEQDRLEELKQKFAGKQASNSSNKEVLDAGTLEKEIEKQGAKVRTLKASKSDKSVWQPEVEILLNLKKQLEAAKTTRATESKTNDNHTNNIGNITAEIGNVKKIEEEIQNQGVLVRKLKESGAAKTEWQPQVNILLSLKAKLAALTGQPIPAPGKQKKGNLK